MQALFNANRHRNERRPHHKKERDFFRPHNRVVKHEAGEHFAADDNDDYQNDELCKFKQDSVNAIKNKGKCREDFLNHVVFRLANFSRRRRKKAFYLFDKIHCVYRRD